MTTTDLFIDETHEDTPAAPLVCLPTGPFTAGAGVDGPRSADAGGASVLDGGDHRRTGPPTHRRVLGAFVRQLATVARLLTTLRRVGASPDRARDDLEPRWGGGWELATGWTRTW